MALLLIVVQSHFIVDNILEGLIWQVLTLGENYGKGIMIAE